MKNYIITIDTGTTNTRTMLWDENRQLIATAKSAVGVRNTAIDGNNQKLKSAVKECLESLLNQGGITYNQVKRVIASGMITSNVGLVEIPHLVVPAGVDDLAQATQPVLLEDICPLPIYFIPGVKNSAGPITLDNLEGMDIMRGEEVESVAILEELFEGKPMLLVLPGSHTKFISVDSQGRMTGCLTSITGELLASITNDTIIADAVGRKFVETETYDKEMTLLGFQTAQRSGLGRTCFSGRILNQFVTKDTSKVGNFILGAALQSDVMAIKNSLALTTDRDTHVVVGGKNPLRQAIYDILVEDGYFADVQQFEPDGNMPLSPLGAYIIAGKSNIL